jgi:hypothetical protein
MFGWFENWDTPRARIGTTEPGRRCVGDAGQQQLADRSQMKADMTTAGRYLGRCPGPGVTFRAKAVFQGGCMLDRHAVK